MKPWIWTENINVYDNMHGHYLLVLNKWDDIILSWKYASLKYYKL